MPWPPRFLSRPEIEWETVFLLLTALLSSTILLKIGQVQYLELLYVLQIALLLRTFARQRFEVRVFRSMLVFAGLYTVFTVTGVVLAGFTLSQDFYIPPFISVLHLPFILAVLRAAELFASLAAMIFLIHVFAHSEAKLRTFTRIYYWAGVASVIYSVVSLALHLLGVAGYGVYGENARWRGFFNEGGPYGLYLMSVILVGMAMRALGWEPRLRLWVSLGVIGVGFLGSRSKSAVIALFLLLVVNALLLQSGRRRLITAVVFLVSVTALSEVVDLQNALRIYRYAAESYERISRRHATDVNLVEGRLAGTFIVPRMVAEHPLLGVGWGNYGLVRNAPEYRGMSAWADIADEPALGVLGQTSEFGIPLTLLLLGCLFFPVVYLRRLRAPGYVLNLALLQPFVHLFGAQLNVTYPWVVTAIALGIGLGVHRRSSETVQVAAPVSPLPQTALPVGAH